MNSQQKVNQSQSVRSQLEIKLNNSLIEGTQDYLMTSREEL